MNERDEFIMLVNALAQGRRGRWYLMLNRLNLYRLLAVQALSRR